MGNTVMKTTLRRTLMQFAISAAVATVTPALAAGMVEGVSAAATTVSDAAMPNQQIAPTGDAGGTSQPADSRIATHGPTRLTALAGNDETAWADAKQASRHARR
jgi:hypothetical protein